MGREEEKAEPNQTWSQLLGSPARFSGSTPSHRRGRGSQQKRTASILRGARREWNYYRALHSAGRPPFESSGPDTGAKASNFMKKRTAKYSDDKGEIIGDLHRIRDELPSIDQLTGGPVRQTKVTIALDDDALSFFKREARRRNTSYQRMIRNLVRAYSQAHRARS